ncbi:hypothetical protein AVEN_201066-1 [Araneus ventricosus]|uniref:Uncharacterized protein n=1 Tax=Araneus ventricosus TaxID=182803 RepID=A0A4Y2TH93_ARAVE|nr:hypothetical protein AVEN_201066-1 [Araneus ventricosus]
MSKLLSNPKKRKSKHQAACCRIKKYKRKSSILHAKVFVPLKKQKPKPTIPLTKEFRKYHQNKHTLQRRKIKFKPKLEKISEVDENENEPEICKVEGCDELKSLTTSLDKTIAPQNNCGNSFLLEVDEDEKVSDLDNLWSSEELEVQVSTINKTVMAPNSVLHTGDSFNYGTHVIVQDEKECRLKQKKPSFFKKKFKNLKKLFKR